MLNEGIINTPPSANHSMPASSIEDAGAQQKASTAAVVDDGWESVEVEEMGAVVAPATPTIALNSTSASSSSSQFGHLVSPPLHQLHPQLASNSILNNVAAPSKSSNGVGPQLSYLQIAGSLMTSSANSSSRPAVYSSNQATSSTPLVHPSSSSSSPFAFVPKPVGKDGHDSFKDAFEQARDKLHLFERRFGGDDGRETTTTATATAAQDATATPTKGEGKRKRSEGGSSDSEKKRTEKKSKKGDEGGADEQKKKKKKKDKKSSGKSKPKKEDGSASLALDEKPEGGFTFMQGAYFILKREHRFMTAKEIVAIGVAEDLFASSKGKTPEATVAAGIYVDLKKPISQFCQGCKVGKRGFGLSEWKDLESIPGPPDTPVKTRRRTTKSEEGTKKKQTSASSTSSRRTAKKRDEEEEARRRRQALLEEEDAEEEEEEIEEEMVIVEEEEDEEEASGQGDSTTSPPNALRPLPFGSPLAF